MINFVLINQGPAMALRNDIEIGAQSLKDKLQIEVQSDMRHGSVRYGGRIFNAKVNIIKNELFCKWSIWEPKFIGPTINFLTIKTDQ